MKYCIRKGNYFLIERPGINTGSPVHMWGETAIEPMLFDVEEEAQSYIDGDNANVYLEGSYTDSIDEIYTVVLQSSFGDYWDGSAFTIDVNQALHFLSHEAAILFIDYNEELSEYELTSTVVLVNV